MVININAYCLLLEDTKYIWNVPVTVSSSDNPKDVVSKTLLETGSATIEIKNSSADKWIKVLAMVESEFHEV